MNAELKTKWIAALRSGRYRQGTGYLRSSDFERFCCLGVLCEVAEIPQVGEHAYLFDGDTSSARMLRGPLLDAVGHFSAGTLANMNDDDEKSFTEIADWIAQHIPEDAA